MSKPLWQYMDEHDKYVRKLLKDLGFTDERGQVRKWNGEVYRKHFKSTDVHSSIDFENCNCKKNYLLSTK
jgi:hypothetical protein